jgi:hypothetical protein
VVCYEQAPDDCWNEKCNTHCEMTGVFCIRHRCQWQQDQNAKPRGARANRTRGGKRQRKE